MGAVLALEGIVYSVIAPLLPEYADEYGFSESMTGLLVAAYPIGVLIGTIPAVRLSARGGSRIALLGGLCILGGATLGFGAADATALLLGSRLVQGLGGAFAWVGGLSLLFRWAPAKAKGNLVGKVLGASVVGLTVGPLLGGLGSEFDREPIFLTAAALCLLLALVGRRMAADEKSEPDRWSWQRLNREILLVTWILCLAAILIAAIEVLVPLRLAEFGASGLMIGLVLVCAALLEALMSPRAGSISDAHGPHRVIGFGLVAAVAISVALALAEVSAVVVAGAICVAFALSALSAPAATLLSNASERAGFDQASAAGLLSIAWSGGGVIGGIAAGGLAGAVSWSAPFVALAAISAGTLGALLSGSRLVPGGPGRARASRTPRS